MPSIQVTNWTKKIYRNIRKVLRFGEQSTIAQANRVAEMSKRVSLLLDKVYQNMPLAVLNGPFKGISYVEIACGSQLLPKLVGSYEEPIHRWIYHILEEAEYSFIFDVGCAEGYYAIGLCKARSHPFVCAYDIDLHALSNAKELAAKNGVSESISFGEYFDPKTLDLVRAKHPGQKILIFMDVEGAEIDLLNTLDFPSVLECDVLVELHDCFKANLTEKIVEYFAKTHKIEIVFDYPWRNGDYFLNGATLTPEELEFIVDEKRPPAMRWMYARIA